MDGLFAAMHLTQIIWISVASIRSVCQLSHSTNVQNDQTDNKPMKGIFFAKASFYIWELSWLYGFQNGTNCLKWTMKDGMFCRFPPPPSVLLNEAALHWRFFQRQLFFSATKLDHLVVGGVCVCFQTSSHCNCVPHAFSPSAVSIISYLFFPAVYWKKAVKVSDRIRQICFQESDPFGMFWIHHHP